VTHNKRDFDRQPVREIADIDVVYSD